MTDVVIRPAAAAATRRRERDLAKVVLVASIGTLVVTGMALSRGRGGHGASGAHLVAGAVLIGASWWHHSLYARPRP